MKKKQPEVTGFTSTFSLFVMFDFENKAEMNRLKNRIEEKNTEYTKISDVPVYSGRTKDSDIDYLLHYCRHLETKTEAQKVKITSLGILWLALVLVFVIFLFRGIL